MGRIKVPESIAPASWFNPVPWFNRVSWYYRLTRYDKRSLLLASTITLVSRLGFVIAALIHKPAAIEVDSYRYLAIANEPGFARWFDLNDPAGYPILLKLTWSTIDSYAGILLLQALLSTLTVAMLFALGQTLLGPKWNRVSALLASLSPLSMFFSSQVMTETSFAFFFLLSALLIVRYIVSPQKKLALFLGGLSLSFATLIRPGSLATIFVLTAVLVLAGIRTKVRWSNAAAFVSGALLLILIYCIGLKIKYDYFGVSVKGPTTLSIYYGIPIMHAAGYSDHFIDSTIAALPIAEQYLDKSRADHISGQEFAARHNSLFFELVQKHPFESVRVHVLGIIQMLAWPPIGLFQLSKHFGAIEPNSTLRELDFQSVFFPLVRFQFGQVADLLRARLESTPRLFLTIWILSTLIWLLVLAAALLGIVRLGLRLLQGHLKWEVWCILTFVLSYILLIPQVAAGSRFRMPLEPLLILIACYFVQTVVNRRRTLTSPEAQL